jgi:hypothetical protein
MHGIDRRFDPPHFCLTMPHKSAHKDIVDIVDQATLLLTKLQYQDILDDWSDSDSDSESGTNSEDLLSSNSDNTSTVDLSFRSFSPPSPLCQGFQIHLVIAPHLLLIMICLTTGSITPLLLYMTRLRGHVYFTSLMSLPHELLSFICWCTMKNTTPSCFGRNFKSTQRFLMIFLIISLVTLFLTTNPTILSLSPFNDKFHIIWASGPWAHVVYILDDDGWAGSTIISDGYGWAHVCQ